ncbi:MAG: hypothetical protein WC788_03685 [Candidatus Paceibacterota bacterium]|jgi:hypothetical protein
MTTIERKGVKLISFSIYYYAFLMVFLIQKKAEAASTITAVTRKIKVSDFVHLIENVFKWSLSVAGGIALIMLIIGGITYMTSTGNEQKAMQAKKTFYWALGGLMLLILAYGIGFVIYGIFF